MIKKAIAVMVVLVFLFASTTSVFAEFTIHADNIMKSIVYDTEDNNNPASAQTISSGTTVIGNFSLSDTARPVYQSLGKSDYADTDFYKFVLDKRTEFFCVVMPLSYENEEHLYLDVSDAAGNALVTATTFTFNDGSKAPTLQTTLDAGTYYFCVMCKVNDTKYDKAAYYMYYEADAEIGNQDSQPAHTTTNTTTPVSSESGFNNFVPLNTYSDGMFADVKSTEWYAPNVQKAYELGLVKGMSESSFNPKGNITIAETLALACRLHSIFNTGSADFTQGQPWYQVYVDYAINNGIIGSGAFQSYTNKATRAEFASIMANALPQNALSAINSISIGKIPDVNGSEPGYGAAVYKLYNAGILTGSDSYGTFNPSSNITRAEVAAIVNRLAIVSDRKAFTPADKPIPVSDIAFNGQNYDCKVGDIFTLSPIITPSNATDRTLTYSSSKTSVATVDNNGLVTAVGAGTTKITVKTSNGKTASCNIVVAKNPAAEEIVIAKTSISVNSVGGVKPTLYWRINSNKQVKYMYFTITAYNAVGDKVKCEIRRTSNANLQFTGPLTFYNTISEWSKDTTNDDNLRFRKGNNEYDTVWNHYDGTMDIGLLNGRRATDADCKNFYLATTFDICWYNSTIKYFVVNSAKVEYMDGTSKTINNPVVLDSL